MQVDGYSLDAQKDKLRKYGQLYVQLGKVNGESGVDARRPVFE